MTLKEKEYRKQSREIITKTVEAISLQHRYKYNRISIRNQKTRLGSCSSKGNLNFNWQIVKFPNVIMEYVIKHELAHLIHHNHSKNFWNEVEKLDSDYKINHKWLKDNAHKYLKFGRIY